MKPDEIKSHPTFSQPWDWTGFVGNTVWDWLELVLLPLTLATWPRIISTPGPR